MRGGTNGTKERIPGEPWWLGEISLFSDITPVIVMPSNWIRFVHLVERVEYLELFPLALTLSFSLFLFLLLPLLLRECRNEARSVADFFILPWQFCTYISFGLAKQNRKIYILFVCFKLFVYIRFLFRSVYFITTEHLLPMYLNKQSFSCIWMLIWFLFNISKSLVSSFKWRKTRLN